MADDEQFSLCWNNFNSNLSAGFHESLCRGDLVDVTLAAEGQFVKAHRLVLSVCSPYFRRMFTQMPANQHAFVFLKDVSHSALKDLIQFMYCGEVNVKQDALPAFISTAEALQIKGLTDSEPAPSQSPAKPSTPAPQPQPQTISASALTTATTTTSPRTRTLNQRSRYKIESEDSGDESKPTNQLVLQTTQTQQHQQPTLVQQTQKRPAQRSITPHTAPTVKRIKNNDPLEGTDATTTTTQITVQAVTDSKSATGEPEYIDLPIDLPTKSEPDYAEEAADVEGAEQEATYVEDDSYGDMKYDESYFTENDDAGGAGGAPTTSSGTVKQSASFSDSYVSDTGEQQQQTSEAQVAPKRCRGRPPKQHVEKETKVQEIIDLALRGKGEQVTYVSVLKGGMAVLYNGHHFKPAFKRNGCMFYRCIRYDTKKCPARIFVHQNLTYSVDLAHNHEDYALLEQHGSIVPSVKVMSAPSNEGVRSLNSEVKSNKESVIYEIVTLPRIINTLDEAKPKIKDIITIPEEINPQTCHVSSDVILPIGASVTIKKIETKTLPGAVTRSRNPASSSISVESNKSIEINRAPVGFNEKKALMPLADDAIEKQDAKTKLGNLTSKDLKEQMKNRLKMALLNAKK